MKKLETDYSVLKIKSPHSCYGCALCSHERFNVCLPKLWIISPEEVDTVPDWCPLEEYHEQGR